MKKKILYVYHLDASNPKVQSGRPHAIYRKLTEDEDIECDLINLSNFMVFRIAYLACRILFGLRFSNVSPLRSKLVLVAAQLIITRMLKKNYDYIFSPTSLWWLDFSKRVEVRVESICCIDIHLHGFIDLYGYPRRRIASDIKAESESLCNFDHVILPSKYAVNSAKNSLNGNYLNKFHLIPFGANLPAVYDSKSLSENIHQHYSISKIVNLLVISSDWERKGGELIALLTNELCKIFSVNLIVIGTGFCKNGIDSSVNIFHYRSLNKSLPEESLIFDCLLRRCDFFLMPSKGEAFGMAVCEALAYGIIPIISNCGGLSEFDNDLESIPRLNESGDVSVVIRYIADVCSKSVEDRLDIKSNLLSLYLRKYNWDVFYDRFKNLILK